MCSIFGFLCKKRMGSDVIKSIYSAAWERGRDAQGIVFIRKGKLYKYIDDKIDTFFENILFHEGDIVIGNCRAVPTTEIWLKNRKDYQPFISVSRNLVCSHNGIIANGEDLKKKYSLQSNSQIDTAIVTELIDKEGLNSVEEIDGGFAFALWKRNVPNSIFLINNFKPIYTYVNDDAIYFSSLEYHLDYIVKENRAKEVEAYSKLEIRKDNLIETPFMTLKSPEKCLVIASPGLDSTTVIGMQKLKYSVVDLIHFTYGCRAEKNEVVRIKKIAKYYNSKLYIVDLKRVFGQIGGSTLLSDTDEIVEGIKGSRKAYEWVPARNTIFLSVAIAFAESHNYDVISLGTNLEESGAYPDNEENYFIKVNESIHNIINKNKHIIIENPLRNMMKHDIVKKGIEIGVPYKYTWSCYRNGKIPCGKCASCYMRKIAFERNSVEDPAFDSF